MLCSSYDDHHNIIIIGSTGVKLNFTFLKNV